MACCRCNRTGRCRNCACVKAGNPCQNCLPGRLGQCLNTEPTVRPEPTASPTAPYFELVTQPPPANPAPSLTPPPPPPLPPPLLPSNTATPLASATSAQTSATSLQILNASSCLPVDLHHPQSASLPSVSWPLPPLQKANFVWGEKDGESFCQDICSAYEHVIHWKPNLFLPPLGSTGTKFVREVARLLQAYADSSSLERIAMKGVAVLQQLLLQKPSKNSKVANRAKHLQRRLDLWHSGDLAALLNEGKCIQKRLSKNPPPLNKSESSPKPFYGFCLRTSRTLPVLCKHAPVRPVDAKQRSMP